MNELIPLEQEVDRLFQWALSQAANQHSLRDFKYLLEGCQERLHQPMRVAIVGVIKAGKSTLMNALLVVKCTNDVRVSTFIIA